MDKRCSCLRVCVLGPPGRGLVEPFADVARKDGGVRSMRFDGQSEAERARDGCGYGVFALMYMPGSKSQGGLLRALGLEESRAGVWNRGI